MRFNSRADEDRGFGFYSRARRLLLPRSKINPGPISVRWLLGLIALAVAPNLFAASALKIQVSGAWIRWLPAEVPAGGYFVVRNLGSNPATLVGASSPNYGSLSIHFTRNEAGVNSMAPVQSIDVKPGARISFAPGGYHLMLMQPKKAIRVGDHIPITLTFADGQSVTVSFEVRNSSAGDASEMKGMDLNTMPGMAH